MHQTGVEPATLPLDHIWNPIFGEGEVVGGSAMAPFERAMVVSYKLSVVTSDMLL